MERRIINIDKEKCNGCGLCVNACHEGAIGMKDGKAYLTRDDYCDGLGDCLPACPTGAITFVVREALEYDEKAVQENIRLKKLAGQNPDKSHARSFSGGCPGTAARSFARSAAASEKEDISGNSSAAGGENKSAASAQPCACPGSSAKNLNRNESAADSQNNTSGKEPSALRQWPVQIKLVPVNAPYFNGANLLVAADCAAYSYANFHREFMDGKITLIGCPKLDMVDYAEKLTAIIKQNNIKSVSVVRMEVPCCGGLENAVKSALMASGKFIPWQIHTLTTDGNILKD